MQETIICEDCGTKVPTGTQACPSCGLSFVAQGEWEERVDQGVGEAFPLPPEEARTGKAEVVRERGRRQTVPAGFWLRAVAVFLDGILMNVLSYGLMAALGIAMGVVGGLDAEDPPLAFLLLAMVISIGIPMAYFVFMESSSLQATLGKKLVGLKVTDLAGNRIGVGRATGRFLGKFVSLMTLYIGFMMAGWTKNKQALHDMMAGTLVVRR